MHILPALLIAVSARVADPFPDLPKARAAAEAHAPDALLVKMETLDLGLPAMQCAKLAWRYIFFSAALESRIDVLREQIAGEPGKCVWRETASVSLIGTKAVGEGALDLVLPSGAASFARALDVAEAASLTPLGMESVSVLVPYEQAPYFIYKINGKACGRPVALQLDGKTATLQTDHTFLPDCP